MTNEQQKSIERLKEITTAYMIGLGYTIPPYNGQHSREYFKNLLKEISEAENRGEEKERKRIVKLIPSSCFSHIGEDLLEKSGIQINSQDPKEEKK